LATVVSITKVSETRVSRTVFDYAFRITVQNGASPLTGVVATLVSAGPGTTIVSGNVSVGDLAPGALVTPTGTVTLRHDRARAFDQSALRWEVTGTIVPRIQWVPSAISVSVMQGTQQELLLEFVSDAPVSAPSISVSPQLASFLRLEDLPTTSIPAGVPIRLRAAVVASASATPGSYFGTMQIVSGLSAVVQTAPVTVRVTLPQPGQAIGAMTTPSEDRLAVLGQTSQQLVADELLVLLARGTADQAARIHSIASQIGGLAVGGDAALGLYQVRVPSATVSSLPSLMSLVAAMPDVLAVSRNFAVETLVTPNDSLYASTWSSTGTAAGVSRHLSFIRAPEAWNIRTSAASVPIAIIDRQVDWEHPDLKDNIGAIRPSTSYNFLPGQIGIFTKNKGHGTAMAGLMCARGNNGFGVVGVAWDCNLNVYDATGVGSGTIASVVAGQMRQAVDDGAKIVNLSLGAIKADSCASIVDCEQLVSELNAVFRAALEYARDHPDSAKRDTLWVIAAGNEGRSVDLQSPASLASEFPERILVVGAVRIHNNASTDFPVSLMNYSNRSGTRNRVDVAAPATVTSTFPRRCAIWDTALNPSVWCTDVTQTPFSLYTDSGYVDYGDTGGTSSATAITSGIAALVRAQHPGKSAAEVKACIVEGATAPVDGHQFRVVNAAAALRCAPPLTFVASARIYSITGPQGAIDSIFPSGVQLGDLMAVEYTFRRDAADILPGDPSVGAWYAESAEARVGANPRFLVDAFRATNHSIRLDGRYRMTALRGCSACVSGGISLAVENLPNSPPRPDDSIPLTPPPFLSQAGISYIQLSLSDSRSGATSGQVVVQGVLERFELKR
jgi:subtilisin family serine protease